MARPTDAQRRQRALASILYQAGGALSNLSAIVRRERRQLDDRTMSYIEACIRKLQELDGVARQAMRAEALSRRAASRRKAAVNQKEPS